MNEHKTLTEDAGRHVIMLYEDRDGDLTVADLLAQLSAAVESLASERDALRAQLDAARAVMRQYENWYDGASEDSWRLQRDMMAALDMQEVE